MSLVLTEDQELIAKTARDFVDEESPISRMRALRDADDPVGFSRDLWKKMAELGWLGIPYPESVGGADMGFADLAVVLEALGRKLAPEPFVSSVLLAGQAILLAGTEEQQAEWLTPMVEGDKVLALAYAEARSRYEVNAIEARAEKTGDGYAITGEKVHVLDGFSADAFENLHIARIGSRAVQTFRSEAVLSEFVSNVCVIEVGEALAGFDVGQKEIPQTLGSCLGLGPF